MHMRGVNLSDAIGAYLWGSESQVCLTNQVKSKVRIIRESHNTVLTCQLARTCGYLEYICADTTRRSECGLIYPEGATYESGEWDFGTGTGEETLKFLLDQIELFVLELDETDDIDIGSDETVVFSRAGLLADRKRRSCVQHLLSMRV
jgi:hypothetical protein